MSASGFVHSIIQDAISTAENHMGSAPTYLFAGGGTGGHLFPGIAVARELQRRDPAIRAVFVGSTRKIESTIVLENRLEHVMLPVEPLSTLWKNPFRFAFRNCQAMRAANRLLEEIRPSAVIGLGGFASAPVVWLAHRFRIPVILLEQNVIPGRTTRWLSRYSDCVCVSFDETISKLKRGIRVIVTGNPVRPEIAALHETGVSESRSDSLSKSKPELLILGGSQGADSLNEAVFTTIQQSRDIIADWKLVHQTGPRQVERARQIYQELRLEAIVEPFFHDMPGRYAAANVVISRAGATTLAELACTGIPMILLPYPHAANNHQSANANAFVDNQAALMIKHGSLSTNTSDDLTRALSKLVNGHDLRKQMSLAAKTARPIRMPLKILRTLSTKSSLKT